LHHGAAGLIADGAAITRRHDGIGSIVRISEAVVDGHVIGWEAVGRHRLCKSTALTAVIPYLRGAVHTVRGSRKFEDEIGAGTGRRVGRCQRPNIDARNGYKSDEAGFNRHDEGVKGGRPLLKKMKFHQDQCWPQLRQVGGGRIGSRG
jgi:hypothetical protein